MIRPVLALTLLLACSLIGGCSDDASPTTPTPEGVNSLYTLAPGDTVSVVGDTSMQLGFTRVVNDRRCPADALCLTGVAFDATLAVSVRLSGTTRPYEITTNESGRVLTVENFNIELVTLAPYPFSSQATIQPGDYRATLRVTSRP